MRHFNLYQAARAACSTLTAGWQCCGASRGPRSRRCRAGPCQLHIGTSKSVQECLVADITATGFCKSQLISSASGIVTPSTWGHTFETCDHFDSRKWPCVGFIGSTAYHATQAVAYIAQSLSFLPQTAVVPRFSPTPALRGTSASPCHAHSVSPVRARPIYIAQLRRHPNQQHMLFVYLSSTPPANRSKPRT